MPTNRYYIVMMDIIRSAKLLDRNELTHRLISGMKEVNKEYKQDLLAPFEITRGDEFAAVLTKINHLYEIISAFQETLSPIEFRTIAAFGELNAGLDSKQSSIIDGPAFQHADSMMRSLKKTSKTFSIDTGQKEWDRIAQAALNLLLWQWNGFTPLQQRIIRLYQKLKNQNKVADEINRSQQQVQATLESCRWELIDEAENSIRDALKVIGEKAMTGNSW
jgi:hypothetical protein